MITDQISLVLSIFSIGFLGMKYGNVINDPVRSNETTWKNDLGKLKYTKRAHKEFNHRHKYYYKQN